MLCVALYRNGGVIPNVEKEFQQGELLVTYIIHTDTVHYMLHLRWQM